jgi:hypothetical protein
MNQSFAHTINPELFAQEKLEEITQQKALDLHTALYDLYTTGETNEFAIQGLLQDQNWYLNRRERIESLENKRDGNVQGRLSLEDQARLERYTLEAQNTKSKIILSVRGSKPYAQAFNSMLKTEQDYITEMNAAEPQMLKQIGPYAYRSRLIKYTMKSMNISEKARTN